MKRMQFYMAWISTLVLLLGTTDMAGCGSKDSMPAAAAAQQPAGTPDPTTNQDQQGQQTPQAPTPEQVQQQNESVAAQNPPQTQLPEVSLTADGLDELLAPIALYPDPVLAIMLQASVNPQEVMDGGNWLTVGDNDKLKEAALDEATKKAGFTPVMMALLHFGPVVDMMCTQFDWTKQLGAAYAADPKAVLDSVQRLRAQAVDTGALKSSSQMTVDVKQDQGKQVVALEPTNPKVVYVPQYNPDQVFGTTTTTTTANGVTTTTTTTTGAAAPAPSTSTNTNTTTVVKEKEGVSTGTAVLIGLLSFGAGMAVGSAINSNTYYYPAWGYGGVWYGPRPYYPPPYHPVYYGGWHGGYGYNRPVHYGNVNINVNNNYYNRFNNNSNLNPNYQPRPVPYNSNPNSNYARSAGNNAAANRGVKYNGSSNYRGATTYQGANNRQPNTGNVQNRPGGANGANAGNRPGGANAGNAAVQRPAGGNAASNPNVQRPATGGANNNWKGQTTYQGGNKAGGANAGANNRMNTGNTPTRNPSGDRGFGQPGGTRPTTGNMQNSRPATGNTPAARPTTGNMPTSRPAGNTQPAARPATQPANRPAPTTQPANRPAPTTQQANRPQTSNGGALAGGSNAKADRAASNRGRQSMGAPQQRSGGGKPAAGQQRRQ
ncbi:MAG TPA: DUF3300 domain-containing protein [Candidatus Acidoferrum sp.]